MTALFLQGCNGGGARMEAPEHLLDTPVPPGWEGQNGLPTTVSMFVLFCDHVSLGPFERGPVQLIVESHGKFNAPDNCRKGDYTYLNILTRIVWSDAEIAQAMQEELGIPTSVGTIVVEKVGQELANVNTFSWIIDGQESQFQLGRFQNDVSENKNSYRYVWPDHERARLGLVDFRWDVQQTQFEPTATYGSFSAPMLLASTGLPFLAGIGVVNEEIFPGGEVKFFEGNECATPSSP